MSVRSRTVRGAVVGGLAATLFLILPRSVEAAGEITAVGWWTRSPTAGAPDGGVAVGSAPDGPTSVAALRVDLGSTGLERLVIQAKETAATARDLAVIKVCAAADTWTPADGGPLAQAPAIDCASPVDFVRDAATGVWQADVSALVAGKTGTASLGLRGAPAAPEDPTSLGIYEIQYERPSVNASTPAGGDDGGGDDGGTITTGTTFAPGTTAPPFDGGGGSSGGGGGGFESPSFDPPTTSAPTATAAPTTTAAPATPTTVGDSEERALLPVGDDAGDGAGRPVQEAFLLVFLAALVGGGVGGMSKLAEVRAK